MNERLYRNEAALFLMVHLDFDVFVFLDTFLTRYLFSDLLCGPHPIQADHLLNECKALSCDNLSHFIYSGLQAESGVIQHIQKYLYAIYPWVNCFAGMNKMRKFTLIVVSEITLDSVSKVDITLNKQRYRSRALAGKSGIRSCE